MYFTVRCFVEPGMGYEVVAGPFTEQWMATDAAETMAKDNNDNFYTVQAVERTQRVVKTVVVTTDLT